jgi:Protein of unknown function (DUF4239)
VNALTTGLVVFACVFSGALIGLFLGTVLAEHHLSADSKDAVKMALGVIGTLAALVLGLLLASAKSSFDAKTNGIAEIAADIILVDRALARYGPETRDARDLLRRGLATAIQRLWPDETIQPANLDTTGPPSGLDAVEDKIRDLTPRTDAQRALQSQALTLTGAIIQTRGLTLQRLQTTIPLPFLIVLVSWFTIIFTCLNLFAPRNAVVMAIMFACALSVTAAIYLILELDSPYQGLIRLSSVPLRNALAYIGQ